jgi:hypothetical protein
MHDYFLGGKDNFAADREAADALLAIAPEIRIMAHEHQAFHARAVRFLVQQGITQFINVASGLPTHHNTHELAGSLTPDARVVYVDDDPVVLTHARAILDTSPSTVVVKGDVLHPCELLTDPDVRRLIDFDQPMAILIFGALQYIPDEDDPFKRMAELRDVMPPGSYLAISHVVFDARPDAAEPIVDIYRKILNRTEDGSRTLDEVRPFFDGLEMVEPGLVYLRQWRPESPFLAERADKAWMAAGVGRKPTA